MRWLPRTELWQPPSTARTDPATLETTAARTALVIPSCRPASLKTFLRAWQPWPWDDTIVVADLPEPLPGLPPSVHQYCWQDLQRHPSGDIISRQDSACRCFGFLQAVARGAEVVLTLDDDCLPVGEPAAWLTAHVQNLSGVPAWASSVPGLCVRGLPYREHVQPLRVGLGMGLWSGHPNLDACHRLLTPPQDFTPPTGVRVMSRWQLFPLCGMNFAFRREVLPALYFPPMGQGSPYSRFDDIWCGLVAQTVLHQVGYHCTVGEPIICHTGASDVFESLKREAPGVAANEWVWRLFADCRLTATTVSAAVLQVADYLQAAADNTPDPAYLHRWGEALQRWCQWTEEVLQSTEALVAANAPGIQ